jgi:acyl-phosphate glycerol 3-phosphate acyltransferase
MPALPLLGLTVVGAYLIGAIPFGYLVARSRGIDILKQGSGNIGATNVGRVLGRRFGLMVFLLDFAKGAVPVGIASALGAHGVADLPEDALPVAAGLAAFLGHLFPVYLRFRGGKGVATGAGIVTVLLPGPALGAILVWLAVLCLTRYVSLASLTAAVMLCVLRLGLTPQPFVPDHLILSVFCLVAAGLVVLRHHANIGRLLHGNENRLKDTPAMLLLAKTVHVLAVGLWFGSVCFFTFAPLAMFRSFESLADRPPPTERPAWLPASFTKENGTQLAGLAVGPVFPWYFLVQGVCGLLALATAGAWAWSGPQGTLNKVRFIVLALALATVLAGWPLVRKVSDLRAERYSPDLAVAAAAKAEFGRWHGYSLLLNFVTLGLVTVAMGLAAQLPTSESSLGNAPPFKENPVPNAGA